MNGAVMQITSYDASTHTTSGMTSRRATCTTPNDVKYCSQTKVKEIQDVNDLLLNQRCTIA